jgi:hypothetical protein
MIERPMLYRFCLTWFPLVLLAAGCAVPHANVPLVDVPSPRPDLIRKLPLQAVILITDEMENYQHTGSTDVSLQGTYTFPLGKMIKKNAPEILAHAFSKSTLAAEAPYPDGTDVVVIPSVEKMKHWYENSGFARSKVCATTAVKLSVLDTKGELLWERVVTSPKAVERTYSSFDTAGFLEATSGAVNESIVLGLREATKGMVSSGEMHAYANRGQASGRVEMAARDATSPVRSDVDELPAVKAKPTNNSYAIVIGIENYRQKIPKADFATHDAKLVAEYLTKVLGYPEQNVVTLTNDHASNVDLVKYFERWLPNNVDPGSSVFVYYSGHGAPNTKTGDAYLVPYDGDPSFIDETGYSLKRMYAALGKLPAKEVVVALDSCFSGAGGRSVIAKGSRPLVMNLKNDVVMPKNMTVLSASSGDQTSSTYDDKGHGLFTYFMLKGIKNEDVVKQDGSLAISDLYSYIKPQVERIARKQYNNEQTPQLIVPRKN